MELEEAKERVLEAAERAKEKSLLCMAAEVVDAERRLKDKKEGYETIKSRRLDTFTHDYEGKKTVLTTDWTPTPKKSGSVEVPF